MSELITLLESRNEIAASIFSSSCELALFCCSEKDILHEEINSLEVVKDKLRARVAELEDEVWKTREAISKKSGDITTPTKSEV